MEERMDKVEAIRALEGTTANKRILTLLKVCEIEFKVNETLKIWCHDKLDIQV